MNSSSTVHARSTDAEPAGRSRTSRANADSIAAIAPLTSHEPRPYSRPPVDLGHERGNRHAVGRHGILMDVEQDQPPSCGASYQASRLSRPGATG